MKPIQSLAHLKRSLYVGATFEITKHWKETLTEHIRQVKEVNTQGIYSILRDFPESSISQANNGRGVYLPWGKASAWRFSDGICIRYRNETHSEENFVLSLRILQESRG